MRLPEGARLIRFTNEEFTQLITYMSGQYGIDLSKKKILAECRMNGELEKRGNISMGEYMRQMEMDRTKQLESILLNRLTTNYTYFMREPKHFDFLREKILPTRVSAVLSTEAPLLFILIHNFKKMPKI